MNFIELRVTCIPEYREILIAEIGAIGFDSMMETPEGFMAYIVEDSYDSSSLLSLEKKYRDRAQFKFDSRIIPKENWNEEWEKNFEPVIINKSCVVRASFHEPMPGFIYEIIIDPKMSFGTGHHETTSLMIGMQMELDHTGKRLLDCGCGTGILSILAIRLGATSVTGLDTDSWAIQNSIENAQSNNVESIRFILGTIKEAKVSGTFDIVLANINKNILLNEISIYTSHLNKGGQLLLSGFYSKDLDDIIIKASDSGLKFLQSKAINDWTGATFIKL